MERRLAAIIAADVVGYSRLMGKDEAGTLARLEGLKAEILDPLVDQHHGRVEAQNERPFHSQYPRFEPYMTNYISHNFSH